MTIYTDEKSTILSLARETPKRRACMLRLAFACGRGGDVRIPHLKREAGGVRRPMQHIKAFAMPFSRLWAVGYDSLFFLFFFFSIRGGDL